MCTEAGVIQTWSDCAGDGHALHVVLHCKHADVVLHSRAQVIQSARGLARLHKLLQRVTLLAISWTASHSVACDIYEASIEK